MSEPTIPEAPQTRIEMYLNAIVQNGSGGNITMDALNATDNGTYTPETGHAYNSVVVAVPTAVGVNF